MSAFLQSQSQLVQSGYEIIGNPILGNPFIFAAANIANAVNEAANTTEKAAFAISINCFISNLTDFINAPVSTTGPPKLTLIALSVASITSEVFSKTFWRSVTACIVNTIPNIIRTYFNIGHKNEIK
jgi:hypothetical protein